jgi:hypothetical protein
MSPHVKEGKRYRMGEGEIEVDSVTLIGISDITPALARESGFLGVLDLLKVAKHGKGDNVYLIRFHYIPPRAQRTRGSEARIASVCRASMGDDRLTESEPENR